MKVIMYRNEGHNVLTWIWWCSEMDRTGLYLLNCFDSLTIEICLCCLNSASYIDLCNHYPGWWSHSNVCSQPRRVTGCWSNLPHNIGLPYQHSRHKASIKLNKQSSHWHRHRSQSRWSNSIILQRNAYITRSIFYKLLPIRPAVVCLWSSRYGMSVASSRSHLRPAWVAVSYLIWRHIWPCYNATHLYNWGWFIFSISALVKKF